MDDLISRRAALEACSGYFVVSERISRLSPIQPEIVRCKDCKYCVYSPATPNAKRPCDPPQPERWHCYKNRDFRPLIMPTDFCSKAESREVTE